jgi:hypothetical protein
MPPSHEDLIFSKSHAVIWQCPVWASRAPRDIAAAGQTRPGHFGRGYHNVESFLVRLRDLEEQKANGDVTTVGDSRFWR